MVTETHTPGLALAPQWLHPPMEQEAPAEGSHLLVFTPTNGILVMPTSQMARLRWDMYP